MRKLLLFFTLLGSLPCLAQVQVPVQTLVSGGAITLVNGSVASFGNIGQPMVFARSSATSNGGGVMVANNMMFVSSTIDTEAPVINSTTPLTITKGTQASFTSNITDNYQTSLNAKLYYRRIAAGGAFDSIALDKSGSTFSVTIPTSFYNNGYDDVGMQYYVKAYDANLVDSTGFMYTYLTNPAAQVSASLLVYGKEQKHYRIISIPYAVSGSVTDVFTDLPDVDAELYRLWQYDTENKSWTEYSDFNTIDRARGYFIILSSDISADVKLTLGSQQAEVNNRTNLYPMTLHAGWNLIGNPYPVSIDWDDVLALNGNPGGLIGTELKVWGGNGIYSNLSGGTLAAFQGAFVLYSGTAGTSVNINIPFLGQQTSGGRISNEVFTTNLGDTKWQLPLTLSQGENEYQMSSFGMHPEAKMSVDQYDDFIAPAFMESIEVSFTHPEHAWGDFARDMVTTRSENVWRFKVKSGSADEAELRWDNSNFGNNDIELFLYDVRTNAIVNMREENTYTFSPGQSKEFKVYYGTDIHERIGPDEITVDEPYPNPFGLKEPVKFVVGLPDNLVTSYPVEMVIRNSVGVPVHSQAQTLAPGLHTLTWTGRKSDNEMPPAGFYFYTIKVGGRSFTGKVIFTNQND